MNGCSFVVNELSLRGYIIQLEKNSWALKNKKYVKLIKIYLQEFYNVS